MSGTSLVLQERAQRRLAALLSILALACGAWALWPALRPEVRAVQVSQAALPALARPEAAPSYATTSSIKPLISGKLNLNTATPEQLEALPNIGPALAGRLTAARPYHNLADLDAVRGVGPVLLAKLTPLVSF